MASQPQPKLNPGDSVLQTACGFQQIGNEMFVMVNVGTPGLATTLVLSIPNAKQFARSIREAADVADKQIIKPPSMLS